MGKGISPEMSGRIQILSGNTIKIAAVIVMLIDHTGAAIVGPYIASAHVPADQISFLTSVYSVMRAIGRTAFPLFCFLLVEGFYHTGNRVKYLRNLVIFAVISEYPFDLALMGGKINWAHQNVFFTLAIGLATIWAIEKACGDILRHAQKEAEYNRRLDEGTADDVSAPWNRRPVREIDLDPDMVVTHEKSVHKQKQTLREQHSGYGLVWAGFLQVMAGMGIMLAGGMLSYYMNTDYKFTGIVLICILYMLHTDRIFGAMAGYAVMCWEPWSFPAFIIMQMYNGKRGNQRKYFFYVFYPAHLIILFLIRYLCLGIK